jgi:AcrR family transcriptional regulator
MAHAKQRRARSPEAKEELRERILAEALALFVSEGYAGFSMRKLGQRLHFTAAALYTYFANKDELLLAIIGQGYERLGRGLEAVEGEAAVERLGAIGEAFMDFAFRNPELYTLMFIQRPGTLFDLSPATVHTRMALLRNVADAARRAPRFARAREASVRQVAELFFALQHGLISLALTMPVFDERWARRNLRSLIDGMRPLLEGRRERR